MDRYFSFLRYVRLRNIQHRIVYLRWYNFVEKSQWWTKDEFENYQWRKVKVLLKYAYESIPYYKELFIKIGATPGDIKSWLDFRNIPILTRETIRERSDDLISKHIKNKSKLKYVTTSGTTGESLGFYKDSDGEAISRAFMCSQWKRVGYHEYSKRIMLRGEHIKNDKLFHESLEYFV
ncbi:MAG: hypothetical protein IQL11_13825 [Bacteroidales bacterium]|nr:hypothetical protein [Bacteroidales bacterium]